MVQKAVAMLTGEESSSVRKQELCAAPSVVARRRTGTDEREELGAAPLVVAHRRTGIDEREENPPRFMWQGILPITHRRRSFMQW